MTKTKEAGDKRKRRRRTKIDGEKTARTRNKKQAAAAVGVPSLTTFFPSNQQDDAVLDVDTAADSEVPLPVNRDDLDVITFSEEVHDGRDEHKCKVVANLDLEDEHNLPYVTTGGIAIGNIPKPAKRKTGQRGKDKNSRCARKSCGLCKVASPAAELTFNGSGGKKYCQYWNLNLT
jgi:hypothetical protein